MQPPSRRTKLSRVINYAPPPSALFLRPIVSFLLPTKLYQSYFLLFRLRFAPLRAGIRVSTIVYAFVIVITCTFLSFNDLFIHRGRGGGEEKEKDTSYLRFIERRKIIYNYEFECHLIMI